MERRRCRCAGWPVDEKLLPACCPPSARLLPGRSPSCLVDEPVESCSALRPAARLHHGGLDGVHKLAQMGFLFHRFLPSVLPHFLCSSSCQSYRAVVEWLIPNASIRYRSGTKREQRGAFNRRGTGAARTIFCQQCSFFSLAQDTPAESQTLPVGWWWVGTGPHAWLVMARSSPKSRRPGGQLFVLRGSWLREKVSHEE